MEQRLHNEAARGGVQVIGRAARILRAVADEGDGMSLGQIAGKVGLPRSTVQRIVNALAAEGLLTAPSTTARIRLGPGLLALASQARRYVVELSHPLLQALSDEIGETIDLAIFRGDHIEFVDQIAGAQRLRAVSAVGEKFPVHNTASGKACLALLPEREARTALMATLGADGGAGVLESLVAELAEVRGSGIAHDQEEHSAGISAIGAGFRDRLGDIYAISIPVPTARANINLEHRKQLLMRSRDNIARLVAGDD